MKNDERGFWTIDELTARVAEALSVGYEGVPSNRVRDVPDLRTIRYYTTLGLLDRPAAMRGRTALYGSRHLLQLVAIKRLQAQGLSLAGVQERVLGKSDAALRKIAEPPAKKRERNSSEPREHTFWRLPARRPTEPARGALFSIAAERADFEAMVSGPLPTFAPPREDRAALEAASSGSLTPFAPRKEDRADVEAAAQKAAGSELQTIPLGNGLSLSFASRRVLTDDDLRSIRAAAAALSEILQLRGLTDNPDRGRSPRSRGIDEPDRGMEPPPTL
jgi:DNA-binding transcriptional MerR regulator